MGRILKRGNSWYAEYYFRGKQIRESSKSKNKSDARKLLKLREGQIAEETFCGLRVDKIKFEELAKDLITDYEIEERKSTWRVIISINKLKSFFKGFRAIEITTDRINAYIQKRKNERAKNGTINRELAALKRMFSIGKRHTPKKVVNIPYIPKLKEKNIRKGFIEHEEYLKIKEALPDYLKPLLIIGFNTGMRLGEILSLTWDEVNIFSKTINLDAEKTKTDESRTIKLTGELYESILKQKKIVDNKYSGLKFVFFRDGKQIKDFRAAWDSAFEKAGLKRRIFHDLRRSAIRNMIRAKVPENVAMQISGHKTRSVFDRYNITDEKDLKKASENIEKYNKEQMKQIDKTKYKDKTRTMRVKAQIVGGKKRT